MAAHATSISRLRMTSRMERSWTSTSYIDFSSPSGSMPCDIVRLPCGSMSPHRSQGPPPAMALLREGRRKIQRGGRLGDAALLVGERDDLGLAAGHVVLRSRSGKPIEDGYSRAAGVVLLAHGQAELALQTVGAGVGDVHRAAAVGAPEPAELEQPRRER